VDILEELQDLLLVIPVKSLVLNKEIV
jgi:hypothetical protein